jgi:hypothetical protein
VDREAKGKGTVKIRLEQAIKHTGVAMELEDERVVERRRLEKILLCRGQE